MVSGTKIYFLARPRRFGKSLLVSTLDALFSGRKELFDGLYIYDKWDWTKRFPVIRLDFGGRSFSTPEELKISLDDFVNTIASEWQISLQERTLNGRFMELVKKLCFSTGQQVVILIDEYDYPIINHLSDAETLTANKQILHNFYPVLKASDDYLEFIFITGISKFSGLSVFSTLNNPSDITMDDNYATICGYTQEELETYFAEYIDDLAAVKNISREQLLTDIKTWYNGYSWDGKTSVYNPYSTLRLFERGKFANYWFGTASPTFLMNMLKKRNNIKPVLQPFKVNARAFDSYNPEEIGEIPLLFQTGYLTIKSVDSSSLREQYILETPNEEVRESFLEYLLTAYSHYSVLEIGELIENMQQNILTGNMSGFDENFSMLLANIPSILHVPLEAYYHSLFLLLMCLLGFDIQSEVMTNIGRIDAVWEQDDSIVIAEIKYATDKTHDKLLKEAMTQIYTHKYYEAYIDRKIMLMAIAFTNKMVKCEMKPFNKDEI
jgi:hypothetical protein